VARRLRRGRIGATRVAQVPNNALHLTAAAGNMIPRSTSHSPPWQLSLLDRRHSMSRDDWYRNIEWNAEIAAAFDAKLRRARDKSQYLRIQAYTLRETRPEIALELLDRYFQLGDHFDTALAHEHRAVAFLTQRKVPEAIDAYIAALEQEKTRPNVRTQAAVDLPFFIAASGVRAKFQLALELLASSEQFLTFPVDFFKWNAAQALIADATGNAEAASSFAHAALDAAARDHSGFRYHPKVGLVPESLAAVRAQMERLCDA
jgi:tetratricopeptide (TPR) repeat protein